MRFRLLIEYDGNEYIGWQLQSKTETVQGSIEQALSVVLKHPVRVIGAGRTDAGVHARGQVAHFDSELNITARRLLHSLNGILKPSIRIRNIERCDDDFHARYSARSRTYRYQISTIPQALIRHMVWHVPYTLDIGNMQNAADLIMGTHNFQGFCKSISEVEHHLCTVSQAQWNREGDLLVFLITANRFLHGMVRSIVGSMVDIGRGRLTIKHVRKILTEQDKNISSQSAPAHGLILEKVEY